MRKHATENYGSSFSDGALDGNARYAFPPLLLSWSLELTIDNARLSCDPPQPLTGTPFTITVNLDSASSSDISLSLEKQRIVSSSGGLELRPTGPNYFELNPQPIDIKAGAKSGTSKPIAVKPNASAEPGEPRVHFPERLLFSAFVGLPSRGFACTIVPVLAVEDLS